MPASSVVADGTAVVAGLLAGLAREEGACIFAGSVACMRSGIFCCSRTLYNVAGTSCSFISFFESLLCLWSCNVSFPPVGA